jgi:hypothetical protein
LVFVIFFSLQGWRGGIAKKEIEGIKRGQDIIWRRNHANYFAYALSKTGLKSLRPFIDGISRNLARILGFLLLMREGFRGLSSKIIRSTLWIRWDWFMKHSLHSLRKWLTKA